MAINTVVLLGRLTAAPELRATTSGVSVTSIRLAVDRKYQPKDATEKVADFINCSAYGRTAEFICRYFNKGQMIGVEGSIQTRTYVASDGNNRTAVEVVIDNASFAGDRGYTDTDFNDYEEIE